MALGDGSAWNEALPDNSTVAHQIDDYNRDLRVGVRSRMALEHLWPSSQTATSQGGEHTYVSFTAQTGDPTPSATQMGALYMTASALTFMSSGGSAVSLVASNGKIPFASINTLGTMSPIQVVGTSDIAVATADFILMTTMTASATILGNPLLMHAVVPLYASNQLVYVQMRIDSTVVASAAMGDPAAAVYAPVTLSYMASGKSSGDYTFSLFWKGTGTQAATWGNRVMNIVELYG